MIELIKLMVMWPTYHLTCVSICFIVFILVTFMALVFWCAEIQAPVTPNTLDHYGGGGGGSSAGASGKGQQSSPKSKQRKKFDASIVGGVEEWRDNGT